MSGEVIGTFNEFGDNIIIPSSNRNNKIKQMNNIINAEEETAALSFISPQNIPTSPMPIPAPAIGAQQSRLKYYRSLQQMAATKPATQQRSNTSPKSEPRNFHQNGSGFINNINNNNQKPHSADQEPRRLSDPLNAIPSLTASGLSMNPYRSTPIMIPLPSSNTNSSHRFRSALHPRIVVDSSASFVLPAPSYLPTPDRTSFLPLNHKNNNEEDHEERELNRKKLVKKYQLEDKQLKKLNENNNNNFSSSDDDFDAGFAFDMEL